MASSIPSSAPWLPAVQPSVTSPGVTGEIEVRQGPCESCDRPDDDLVAVHRMYVVPESWDTPGSSKTMDEVEWWCFSCRSMYPHSVLGT